MQVTQEKRRIRPDYATVTRSLGAPLPDAYATAESIAWLVSEWRGLRISADCLLATIAADLAWCKSTSEPTGEVLTGLDRSAA